MLRNLQFAALVVAVSATIGCGDGGRRDAAKLKLEDSLAAYNAASNLKPDLPQMITGSLNASQQGKLAEYNKTLRTDLEHSLGIARSIDSQDLAAVAPQLPDAFKHYMSGLEQQEKAFDSKDPKEAVRLRMEGISEVQRFFSTCWTSRIALKGLPTPP